MKYGWLLFFVLAFPAAVGGITLSFEAARYPAAVGVSSILMRLATLLVVAGIAGWFFGRFAPDCTSGGTSGGSTGGGGSGVGNG